jgi:hypothetical protein
VSAARFGARASFGDEVPGRARDTARPFDRRRNDGAGQGAVERELSFSKVGREGRTERVAPDRADPQDSAGLGAQPPRPAWLDRGGPALRTETCETARLRHPGHDIYFVEDERRA